jgi:uncharacterized repeat protein (TIGR03803 family)
VKSPFPIFRRAPVLLLLSTAVIAPLLAAPAPVEVLVPPKSPTTPHALVVADDGALYGFTGPAASGPYSAAPGFFRYSFDGQFTSIPVADSFPYVSKPFVGADGNIYSFADVDGRAPADLLVRVTLNGGLSTIFDFRSLANIDPRSVFQASSGNFYVLSATGGANNSGVVLRITSAGAVTTVFDFPANTNSNTLVLAEDGNFYGLANFYSSGSRTDYVFRISSAGAFAVIHTFDPVSEGQADYPLAVGPDGALYGLSSHGSVKRALFRVTLAGEMTAFSDDVGLTDLGELVLAPDGNFYTAQSAVFDNGIFKPGSIVRISTNGTFALVHQFQSGEAAGLHPLDLVLGPDGNIYGDSYDGGVGGGGTIFRLSIATGEVGPIHSFSFQLGASSALTQGPDGKLYGVVKSGGAQGAGYIFRVSALGVVEKVVDFGGNNGVSPVGKLLLASDGNFYGTTDGSGANFGSVNSGTIFQLTPAGVLTTLFSFDSSGAQGRLPRTRLTEGPDGKLYGIAQFGGAADLGTVFRISKTGAFELLNSFPKGHEHTVTPLTLATDGNFYCMTIRNVLPAAILRVTPNGIITELTKLAAYPPSTYETTLVPATDGSLYGFLTNFDRADSIVRCTLDGVITTVANYEFGSIATDITLATDGNFYLGRFAKPGGYQIARVTPDGITIPIATFPAGEAPAQSLTQSSDGRFYGPGTSGSVFRAELLSPTISSVTQTGGASSDYDLTGTSLTDASRVTFGGQPATNFTAISDNEITATAPAGADANAISITTPAGVATFPQDSVPPGPALNISTRGDVTAGSGGLIGGFIVQGNQPKKVLIRAIGPSLAQAGVAGVLGDPVLELHDGGGALVIANDDWQNSTDQQAIAATGIPPSDPRESAVIQTLNPGTYTAVVHGAGSSTGVALVEVYDLDSAAGKLANISTRGSVQAGDDVMIGGFIIGDDAPARVLVRAIGPSLANANPPVPNALADPQLELRDGDGNLMAMNDNWQDTVQAQEIADTTIAPSDPKESAIVASLNPGNYTAIVRGVNNTTGVGLVEVYKLD